MITTSFDTDRPRTTITYKSGRTRQQYDQPLPHTRRPSTHHSTTSQPEHVKQAGEDLLPTPPTDTNPKTGRADKRSRSTELADIDDDSSLDEVPRTQHHHTEHTHSQPHRPHPSQSQPSSQSQSQPSSQSHCLRRLRRRARATGPHRPTRRVRWSRKLRRDREPANHTTHSVTVTTPDTPAPDPQKEYRSPRKN